MLYTNMTDDILEKLGVNTDELPDNLYSTKLKALAEAPLGGGSGGGVTHWDDLEGKPFYEEIGKTNLYTNNISGEPWTDTQDDGVVSYRWGGQLNGLGTDYSKTYCVVIRGDMYKNLSWSAAHHNYYDYRSLGNPSPYQWKKDNGDIIYNSWEEAGEYPFSLYKEGNNDDDYVHFFIRADVYPDLDFETEIQVYEYSLKTIDPKYLPESVKGGAFVVNFTLGDTVICDKTHKEIYEAAKSGRQVLGYAAEEGDESFVSIYHLTNFGKVSDEVHIVEFCWISGTDSYKIGGATPTGFELTSFILSTEA